jgi:hypothetical protein
VEKDLTVKLGTVPPCRRSTRRNRRQTIPEAISSSWAIVLSVAAHEPFVGIKVSALRAAVVGKGFFSRPEPICARNKLEGGLVAEMEVKTLSKKPTTILKAMVMNSNGNGSSSSEQ